MIIILIWTVVLIAAYAVYYRQIYSRYKQYGVKYNTPVPILGNMANIMFRRVHVADDVINIYNQFPGEKFVGRYEFNKEQILIRDLDLVKQVTVKDFEYFLDHRAFFGESDSFFARNLFALKGQEWKDMRSALSPAFTSSKIRVMVPFMVEVGDQMIADLKKKLQNSNTDYINVDSKDLTTRYANDVIATCAFGLKVDSMSEVDNQFYAKGKKMTNFDYKQVILFFMLMTIPKLTKILGIDFLGKDTKEFFMGLVLDTMKNRELKNIIRPDMIHLLMELRKGSLTHDKEKKEEEEAAGFATVEESAVGTKKVDKVWTDADLVAQAMLFFFAGFETASSAMTFLLHELAVNPDVQDRLAKEIREHDAKNNGKFDFNSIQTMNYLDMVVSELLRLWPPAPGLDRECIKDYNIGRPNKDAKEDFIIRKGTGVGIPSIAFHRDPQYFPNPDKFDPERFSEENKHKINSFAYMPFGVGPRNCIGSRFALCEMKAMTYQLMLHMEVSPSETTVIPAKLSAESFSMRLQGGHTLRFKLRP